jgi:RNA polymerase sigma factor (TIGR02999 family)
LVDVPEAQHWNSRGHFFAAAAEAMRRITIERARARATQKRGGNAERVHLDQIARPADKTSAELLQLNEALSLLEEHDAQAAALVKLRYFAGLSHQEAADALGITRRVADRLWALARAWLYRQVTDA